MNPSLDKALYYLTGNGDIDKVGIDELEQLVSSYPYFAPAHLLLARKLKKDNHAELLSSVQKAAVYFPNPYWLHYQVMDEKLADPVFHSYESAPATVLPVVKQEEADQVLSTTDNAEDSIPITTEFTADEINEASDFAHESLSELDETPMVTDEEGLPVITSEFTSEEIETASELAHEVLQPTESFEVPATIEDNADTVEDKFDANEVPFEGAIESDDTEELSIDEESAIVHPTESQVEEEFAAIGREPDQSAEEFIVHLAEEKQQETTDTTPEPKETTSEKEQELLPPANETVVTAEHENEELDEHEKMFQNIKAMLDATTEEADKGADDNIIPIDPYHTIDYFASQGIRLELEPNPQDKLGKQLKKFTQWLKHMKKLGPEDAITSDTNNETEADIQNIADNSNTAREVVTEAMAQVLEKQGKTDKAIQLYIKLSFLNPHKSTYFADKIKNLKGI